LILVIQGYFWQNLIEVHSARIILNANMRKTTLTLLFTIAALVQAYAGGYQVVLQSNRSTAMGNTGVALMPRLSSINFNPGALSMTGYSGVSVGGNLIFSSVAFRPFDESTTYNTDSGVGTPFHVFGAYQVGETGLALGLGIYTPFGSSVSYPDDWYGRYDLQDISLSAVYIQPTVSYAINDMLSIGAGFIYAIGGVNLQRYSAAAIGVDGSEIFTELDGSANGMGYNLGVFFKPSDRISFGVNYRSNIDMEVEDGTFTASGPATVVGDGRNVPSSTGFTASLPLVSSLTIGTAFKPMDELTLSIDVAHNGWAVYDSLVFEFDDAVGGSNRSGAARNYNDAFTFRFGAEYMATEALAIRAGFYFDETPVPNGFMTPETPDADTFGYTLGAGYDLGNIIIDASLLFVNKTQRENRNEASSLPQGTYKTLAVVPGVTAAFKF
jgi:long-chain fatty acid transport protein